MAEAGEEGAAGKTKESIELRETNFTSWSLVVLDAGRNELKETAIFTGGVST